MTIDFNISGELKHINVRKEGPDDDKVTALDLKFTADVTAQLVDDLLCVDEEKGRALAAFWSQDGAPQMLSMGDIKMSRQILNAKATLAGMTFGDCTAKNFSFAVKDKHAASLTFSISSADFPSNAIAVLAEKLQEGIDLHFWTPQGDLFQEGLLTGSVEKLDKMLAEDGATATITSGDEVLATFGAFMGPGAEDPLYGQALAFVRESGRPSISFVQRKFRIGYNRAARLIEAMEAAGQVTPMGPAGEREVITKSDSEAA